MSETWDGPIKCGWCGVTMQTGDTSKPISHSICEPCSDKLADNLLEERYTGTAVVEAS